MKEPITAEVLELLNTQPWPDIIKRLTLHAEYKVNRLRWRNSMIGRPPSGIQAIDIVQEVITRIFEGRRKWDPVRHPDFYLWAQDAVDSAISFLVGSSENRKFVTIESPDDESLLETPDEDTPESLLLKKQEESDCETTLLELLDFLDAEPDLQKLIEAFISGADGTTKRADLARHLGITVAELDSARKRLDRRINDFRVKRTATKLEVEGRGPK